MSPKVGRGVRFLSANGKSKYMIKNKNVIINMFIVLDKIKIPV